MHAVAKHIAVYMRVSTGRQDTRSQWPELQQWAAAQNRRVVWYEDEYSGRSMDRPGWNRLQEAIRAGQVATVVVWRLDRLGRTARGLTALFEELIERKINLISLKDGVDLSTAAGRLMANVLASVAQFETEVRAERVRAGQEAARAAGKRWGGTQAGIRKKVTPTMERAILRLYEEATPITEIAAALGLSRPTIYAVLRAQEPAT